MPQLRQQRGPNLPASISRDTSRENSSETEVDGENLFDYVVDSSLRHDPLNNSFSSSSAMSATSSRRGQRSLRVKRYTNDGDEVVGGLPHDSRLVETAAAPTTTTNATHSSSPLMGGETTSRAHSSLGHPSTRSPLGQPHSPLSNHTSRALRTKRYLHHPSTISSEPEDMDEDDDDDDDDNDDDVEEKTNRQHSERQTPPLPPPPPPPTTTPPDDINNKLSIASSTDVWMSKGGPNAEEDDDDDDHEVNFQPAPLRPAPDHRNRRQAALLASAAIAHKGQLKRKGEAPIVQQSTTETDQAKMTHMSKDQSSDDQELSESLRVARIEVLAARKRKLEALAKISASSLGQVGGKQAKRKPRQTISLDVHPEEEVKEEILPALSAVSPSREVEHPRKDKPSVSSKTSHPLPASKAIRKSLLCLLFLLLAGGGVGIYFGIVYRQDEDPDRSNEASISPPTAASLPIASPVPLPTRLPTPLPSRLLTPVPTRVPTPQSSLRPVAAAPTSAPVAKVPSRAPVITSRPSEPSVTIPSGVNSALFSLLLSEWPALNDTLTNAFSPQVRALLWLSLDEGLSTYSTQRKKQRFALATFFFSTNGQSWKVNEGWLSDADECQWYTADASSSPCDQNGSYVSLKLNYNDLEGSIPPELALLSASLTSIDLVRGADDDETFLSGILPSEIGKLEKLLFLNLNGNKLERSIPTEIGFLTGLRRLQLYRNSFTGQIPTEIGLLTGLRELNLSDNFLSVLPSEIGKLSILVDFSASSNILSSIPSEIGNLSRLATMDLSSNRLSGRMLSELGNLRSLTRMDLSSNALAGSIPSAIGNLDVMVELLLHSNRLTGQVPSSFSSLDGIGLIRIESNPFLTGVPSTVCTQFAETTPIFVADCDLDCPCCTHCCANGSCECLLVAGTGLFSLCDAFP